MAVFCEHDLHNTILLPHPRSTLHAYSEQRTKGGVVAITGAYLSTENNGNGIEREFTM